MWNIEHLESRTLLTAYYVATTGNDASAGTSDAPWKTLQHAANLVREGDVVTVRAGHYSGFQIRSSGSATRRITFRAELGVIIDHPNTSTGDGINLEGASFVTIQRFYVTNQPRAGIRSVTNTGVQILGNVVDKNTEFGILTGFSQDVLIDGNVAKNTIHQHGIYVSNSADNPIIRGNVCFGNHDCGIQINSDASQGGDGTITGAIVENNTIYSNGTGGSGINLDGVQRSVIRNNLLYDTHNSGISLYWHDAAAGARNNLIINNTIVMANDVNSPGRFAVNIQNQSTGNIVRNNVLYSYFTRAGDSGSVAVSSDSVAGTNCDYNIVSDKDAFADGDDNLDFGEWQAATKFDLHSKVIAPADLFYDLAAGNYHLKFGSAGIDAGSATLAPPNDFNNDPRPSPGAIGVGAIDIGAFEFQRFDAPINLRARATGNQQIDLSWNDLTAGQTKTVIYRRMIDGSYVKIKTLPAGATSFRDTDVSAATRYYYRVLSYSDVGRSVSSDAAGAITWPATPRK